MRVSYLAAIDQALEFRDIKIPELEEDQVVLNLKSAALNHRDLWIIKGLYRNITLPVTLGSDGVGTVDGEAFIINPNIGWGENESFPSKDYQILGLETAGTFQECIAIKKDRLVPKPLHLSWNEAAALPLAGLTAYRVLFSKCNLKKGEKVFISGIGGGVALMAFKFAMAAGADVYVSSSSDLKIEKAVDMGAKGGVNYKIENWGQKAKKEFGGFDVLIDSAGGDGFNYLVKLCNPAGRIGIYGGTQGMISNLIPQHLFFKQISILGSTMGSDQEFAEMVNFVSLHQIIPIVDSVFKFSDINKALQRMDNGLQFGKIILKFN